MNRIHSLMTKTVVALALVTNFAACANASSASTPSAPPTAEQLALQAEQSIARADFERAFNEASAAVALDPQNVRGRLWKAALAPSMELKGSLSRVRPLAMKNPVRAANYKREVESLRKKASVFAAFLLNGPEDISSERDVQELIARVIAKTNSFRLELKALKNESLKIEGSGRRRSVELNPADFEAASLMVAAYQVSISALNSYDLTGATDLLEAKGKVKTQQMIESALRNPQFGKLRDGRALTIIPEITRDAVLAARTAQVYYNDLCPQGSARAKSRPGKLFHFGLCVEPTDSVDTLLRTIEYVATHNSMLITFEGGESVMTNVPMYIANPIADLREVAPIAYDNCGEVVAVSDATLRGLIPRGELANLLKSQSPSHKCSALSRR